MSNHSAQRSHAALGAVILLLAMGRVSFGEERPNIIVFYVDDLRHDGLGVTGHPFVETPVLDYRVGGLGTVFRNSFVTTPVCSPSRASILSGQYVRTHGLYVNEAPNYVADSSTPNYHSLLQSAGYRTAHVGKWHRDAYNDARPGYDYWASFIGQGTHSDVTLNVQVDGNPSSIVQTVGWTKEVLTDYALDFLNDYGSGGERTEPFALTLSFKAVHAFFGAGETASGGAYSAESVDRPVSTTSSYGGFDVHEEKPIFDRPGFMGPSPSLGNGVTQQRSQMEMMRDIDQQIGRVLDRLDQKGLGSNTIVMFTSDNGFFWGEHGRGDKRAAYEESIRVPLLIRDPRQTATVSSSDALALNIDIAPTILDAAGIAKPDWMQGMSLMPILQGDTTQTRDAFAAEYYQEVIFPNVPGWEALRTDRYMYVRYPEHQQQYDELYDLQADPYQLDNLLGPTIPEQAIEELRSQLGQRLNQELATIDSTNNFRRALVNGDTRDVRLLEDGTVIDNNEPVFVGARADTGGSNLVLSFELPVLSDAERVQKAYVGFEIISNPGGANATHAIDLWAIGVNDGTPLIEFLEADRELLQRNRGDNIKLQDNIITADSHFGRNFSDESAADTLASYLGTFYDEHPDYSGGKFLQVRLNPDSDFGDVNRAWTIANADSINNVSGQPFFKRLPVLSLEIAPLLPGDYNNDGTVSAADYTVWRDNLGSTTAKLPNDATPNLVFASDYEVWRNAFGTSISSLTSFAVPEAPALQIAPLVAIALGVPLRQFRF